MFGTFDWAGKPPVELVGLHLWPHVQVLFHSPLLLMESGSKGQRKELVLSAWAGGAEPIGKFDGRLNWVMVISPPWVNGTSEWKMDQLMELWEVSDPETGNQGALYVTKAGQYVDFIPHGDVDAMTRVHRAY